MESIHFARGSKRQHGSGQYEVLHFIDVDSSLTKICSVIRSPHASNPKAFAKPKKAVPITSLNVAIHESEMNFQTGIQPCHRFEVGFANLSHVCLLKEPLQTILEPSSYSPEKFELYKKYQQDIHHDPRNSPTGFKQFLVDSPLIVINASLPNYALSILTFSCQAEPIPYSSPPPSHLPLKYGSYHQLYKLGGKLIAMGVIDILPSCVSSVYFVYDKSWERFSLGKVGRTEPN